MISYDSNIDDLNAIVEDKINISQITRDQATTQIALMRERIHEKGIASDGSQIGTYSRGYLNVRSGNYPNSKKRDSGVYSRGKQKGSPRAKHNRGSDTKVIISLTRQLESDYTIIPIEKGHAVGVSNPNNFKKAKWSESTYKKSIFSATEEEVEKAIEIANEYYERAYQ